MLYLFVTGCPVGLHQKNRKKTEEIFRKKQEKNEKNRGKSKKKNRKNATRLL